MKNFLLPACLLLIIGFYGCSSSGHQVRVLPRSYWNAQPPKPFVSHVPVRITIHHEGEYFNPDSNAAKFILKTQIWGMGKDRNWADIPYHFMIDGKGNIYEGRNPYTAGETNTTYDPKGHLLVTCIGNFEEQEMTPVQLEALTDMLAFCCKKYHIDPDTIKGHKDFAETLCPGKNLYKYLQDGFIIATVKEKLQKMN
ncbi:MAG: peptidoglycan recognition family protein [Bacteroidota bacterium]